MYRYTETSGRLERYHLTLKDAPRTAIDQALYLFARNLARSHLSASTDTGEIQGVILQHE